jgi:hypothetical protein
VEIIHQTKGHEFTKNNPQWTDEEFNENVNIEKNEIIKIGNKKILNEHIKNNEIEYNVIYKTPLFHTINNY